MGVTCVALYRMIGAARPTGKAVAVTSLVVAVAGAVCLSIQMIIDLVAGFATSTVDDKNAFTDEIQALPGVEPLIYRIGRALLFTALLIQTVHVAMARRVPVSVAVLIGASVGVMVADRIVDTPIRLTLGVAATLLWIAFAIVVKKGGADSRASTLPVH